jgi:hypothetical protein
MYVHMSMYTLGKTAVVCVCVSNLRDSLLSSVVIVDLGLLLFSELFGLIYVSLYAFYKL